MRPPNAIATALCALAPWVAAGPAAASIALELTTSAAIEQEALNVELTVANGGDEPALSLVPAIAFDGGVQRGESHARLGPGESLRRELSLPFASAGAGAGRWPVVVTIDYTDANGYLLQALQVFAVQAGQAAPGGLLVSAVEASHLAARGRLAVTVRNMTGAAQTADLAISLPRGIEPDRARVPVSLDGWAEERVVIGMTNRSALPGSRLPTFAVLEWEAGGQHHAAIGSAVVEVVERQALLGRYRLLALVGGALLVLAVSVRLLSRRAARRPAAGED